jgi:hypothetical protein
MMFPTDPTEVFAPDAFDGNEGKRIKIVVGRETYRGVILAARVRNFGTSAHVEVQVEVPSDVARRILSQ